MIPTETECPFYFLEFEKYMVIQWFRAVNAIGEW